MKSWLLSLLPFIIFTFLYASFQSSLGLLQPFVIFIFLIVGLASYYIPYQLIEGEFRSTFYACVCLILFIAISYKIDNHIVESARPVAKTICGNIANKQLDQIDLPSYKRKRLKLYQFDVVSDEQGIQHFRKEHFVQSNGASICVTYIDQKDLWLYAEHKILNIKNHDVKTN